MWLECSTWNTPQVGFCPKEFPDTDEEVFHVEHFVDFHLEFVLGGADSIAKLSAISHFGWHVLHC